MRVEPTSRGRKKPLSLAAQRQFSEEGWASADFGKKFELYLVHFLRSLERSVLMDLDSVFPFSFCSPLLYCLESGKERYVHGLDKDFSALAMADPER